MSEINNSCRLCKAQKEPYSHLIVNKVLFSSDNYIVIPTLGQFVEGWLMVVSKEHQVSARNGSIEQLLELSILLKDVKSMVKKIYGPVIIFEHGPGDSPFTKAGCCIEHTHLHIVPLKFQERFRQLIKFKGRDKLLIHELPKAVEEKYGYLILNRECDKDLFELFIIYDPIPRQYLRRLLAQIIEQNYMWNWQQYPYLNNIKNTNQKILLQHNIVKIPGLNCNKFNLAESLKNA